MSRYRDDRVPGTVEPGAHVIVRFGHHPSYARITKVSPRGVVFVTRWDQRHSCWGRETQIHTKQFMRQAAGDDAKLFRVPLWKEER